MVLDNCEHLLDAAAQLVAAIVGSCPGVTVLATGREGLGVRGERMMMVRSLPLPGERCDDRGDPRRRCGADAVHRACSAGRRWPGPRRRDGGDGRAAVPAARRDSSRARVGGGAHPDDEPPGDRGASRRAVPAPHRREPHRGRTPPDAAPGRRLELRPARRTGTHDPRSSRRVLRRVHPRRSRSGGRRRRIEPGEVLDGVAQLVDKSLVVAEREHHDTRYRLLETIRTYALERLDESGGTDTMRRRHATWCAGFIAQASIGTQSSDESAWLERLDREIDNVRAALTWATGADDADLSLSLIGNFGIWNLYSRRLGYVLGPWAAAALATTGAADDPRFVSVLAIRALDHLNHQRLDEAERDARQALELMAEPDIPFSVEPVGRPDPDPHALGPRR